MRSWLGNHPTTDQKYLPDSTKSAAGTNRGIGIYQLRGVLVDADLFTRLRLRGQTLNGDRAIAVLQGALDLVAGQPFDQVRPGGYSWLTDTSHDHHLTAAIVDTAHLIHVHHLARGDIAAARAAAEKALLAAPYEEIPRLDLAAILRAEGLDQQADRYLRDEVCNRDAGTGQSTYPLEQREF